ncbi:MAG: hypothetical protein MSIBF_02850 [Candidatus Altiarchaeales archaeon IMC4]|nr:MAG: hypothetical protein MSIBF_02850 [Candidatus Altiarchaeales archaeon IMC4]
MESKTKKTIEKTEERISEDIDAAVKKINDLSQDYKLEERRDEIMDDIESIERFIKEHPVACAALAAVGGYILGSMMQRGRKDE